MYVRTIQRKNQDGSTVEYVQLAHNAWNPKKGFAQAEVIYSFGRRDQLDIEAIRGNRSGPLSTILGTRFLANRSGY